MGAPRRWLRRIARVLAAAVLALVVLVACVLAWATLTGSGRAFVLERVLAVVEGGVLDADIEVGTLSRVLGRVVLEDVRIATADGRPLVDASRVEVSYRLRPLLSSRVELPEIVVVGRRFDVRIGEDGRLNLATLVPVRDPPSTEKAPWEVELSRVTVRLDEVVVTDHREGDVGIAHVAAVDTVVGLSVAGEGTVTVRVEAFGATVTAPIETPVRIDAAEFALGPGSMALSVGSLQAIGTRIDGTSAAMATGIAAPFDRVDVSLPPFVVDPEAVNPLLPEGFALRVPVTVAVEAHGPVDAVELNVPLTGAGGEIELRGVFDLSDAAAPGWQGELRLARFVPADWATIPVDADVSGSLRVDGVGFEPTTARARARLDLGPSSVSGFGLDGAFLVASYDAGAIDVTSFDAWRTGTRVRATASVDPSGSVAAWLDVSAPDLSDLATDLRFSAAGDLRGDVQVRARVDAELGFDPTDPAAYPTTPDEWMDLGSRVHGDGSVRVRRFDGLGARVDRLDLAWTSTAGGPTPDVDLTATGQGIQVGGAVVDRANVALGFDGTELDVRADASLSGGSLAAEVAATARLGDDLVVDVARLDARAGDIDATLRRPVRVVLELDADRRPTAVALSVAAVTVVGVDADVQGRYGLESGSTTGRVDASSVDLASLAARFAPDLAVAGTLSVAARVGGTLARPSLSLDASVAGLRVRELEPHEVLTRLELDRGVVSARVDVSRDGRPLASIATGDAGIPVDVNLAAGRLAFDGDRPLALEATIERLELGSLAPLLPPDVPATVTGDLALDLGVSGTLDAPQVVVAIALTDTAATIAVGKEQWVVDRSSGTLRLRLDGTGELWRLDGDAALAAFGRDIVQASVRTEVDPDRLAEDPVAALEQVVLDGHVAVLGITVADLPGSVRDAADLRDGRFDADIRWTGPARSGEGTMSLAASSVRIGELEPMSFDLSATAGREVTVAAVGLYGPSEAAASASGPTGSAGIAAWLPPEGDVGVGMEFRLGAPLATLLDAEARARAPVEARVFLPTSELARAASALPSLAEQPGTIGGYVDLWGTLGTPRLSGRLALRDVALANGARGAAGVGIGYADGLAQLDVMVCEGADPGIEARVAVGVDLGIDAITAGLGEASDWALSASVTAPGVDVAAVVPQVLFAGMLEDVEGRVDIDLRATGTVGAPRLDGTVRIAEARAGVIPMNRTFENVSAEVAFTTEGIEVVNLAVDDERGRVRGSGRVALRDFGFAGANLELRARDFLFSSSSGAGAFVTGDVTVTAQEIDDVLSARVTLSDVEVTLPDDVGGAGGGPRTLPEWVYFEGEDVAVEQRGARSPASLVVTTEPTESEFRMVVEVLTGNRGVVRHQLAEIWFDVDLDVTIDGGDVAIEGHVDLPDGVVRVAGKDFDVTDRRVTFPVGADVIDPYIDVEAVHDLGSAVTEYLAGRGWVPSGETATVSVVVRGSVSDLVADPENAIRLVSDPRGLSEPDVFHLLATGRMSDDSEAADGQQGVAALTSLMLGLAGDQIAGGIPIDTLSIESTSESQRVEGGKYISDDIYVSGTYIRSPDDVDDNNFEVALEWILRRIGPGSLRLELRGGDRAKGGLELLYNLIRGR